MFDMKLPSNITFELVNDVLKVKINSPWLNMQNDSSAFEAWIIALKANNEKIKIVILDFDLKTDPTKVEELHQNRFLFRLSNFKSMFTVWFFIDQSKIQKINDFIMLLNNNPVVNAAKQKRKKVTNSNGERYIEWLFTSNIQLIASLSCQEIINQIPVGVFDGEVTEDKRIFPGGGSAIDLIGIDNLNNVLHFIELKSGENNKLGIISESLFYVFVLHNIFVTKKFRLENYKQFENLDNSKEYKIKGHFLCEKFHPLLNKKTLDLLNEGLKKKNITFDKMEYKCELGLI